MLIKEMSDRTEFTGFYLLKSATLKSTADQRHYLDLVIADATGEIPLKFWDISEMDKETYFSGMIVKVQGTVSLYREKLQAKVVRMRAASDQDGYAISDFVKSAPVPPADLLAIIEHTISEFHHPKVKKIVNFCVGRVREQLMSYPAGKSVHHAYYAGLAYHIVRMLEIADFLCKQRPFLNQDLLKAGILLHDLCKVEEFEGGEQGIVTEYTVRGNLLGHISIVNNWISEAAITYSIPTHDPVVTSLQHLVLSHHGKLEYGSPVLPQLPEAIALAQIDLMDSRLQAVEDALMGNTEECITSLRAIEGGRVYRLTWDEEQEKVGG
ncbi:3'-5' exoribonuclease YhaM family protein [Ammoniphilus sp. CFH 90114]|uniref:3'-5' exoribonuclease YhaM family protein n=1 Tax=Ammoniphilus sp. CFH 90114 TaxID=2493665 RepID=UPI00100E1D6B|nr:HD domain-containing protein [Ammoniphilus sp. CFH 90114]RXT06256.1 HD domain-containing protein [Ammoniphilus sp. CFH 90114]